MTQKKLISIVLQTYNVAKYIERCIRSLARQDYKCFEIIVVDDCGHDDSIKRVKHLQKRINNNKIVSNKKNLGTYHARRVGAEHAQGEYIIFLDPDDEMAEGF